MVEDIGKIISKGFETYTKNLNLGIPFVFNILVTGIISIIIFLFGLIYIFGTSISTLGDVTDPEQLFSTLLPLLSQHIFEIGVLIIIYILIYLFISSFFIAGAVGMAKQATEAGRSDLSTMLDAGIKNVVNLFLAEILVGLIFLAGIVFMLPGALEADINQMSSPEASGSILLIIGGFLLWMLYLLIISIILGVLVYALVVDNLGPVDGVFTSFRFFNNHKLDVFLIWLITIVIVVVFSIIGQIIAFIPVIGIIWPLISPFISALIIMPLTTVWWVRLYMTRTDKKIYIDELLAHPNDIEERDSKSAYK